MIELPESYEDNSDKDADKDEAIDEVLKEIYNRAFCIAQRARVAWENCDIRDKMIADIKQYVDLLENEVMKL